MVLVSLVGDFSSSIVPIFYEFRHDLHNHVLVYDHNKRDTNMVYRLLEAQKTFIESNNMECAVSSISMNEDSLEDLHRVAEEVLEFTDTHHLILLNGTDGLGNVKVVLSNLLNEKGAATLFYNRHENAYNKLNRHSMQNYKIKHNLNILEYLHLKGFETLSYTPVEEMEERREVIFYMCKDLLRLKAFSDNVEKNMKNPAYYDMALALKKIGKNTQSDQDFVRGKIFEEYIFWLLKELPFDEVLSGVKVRFSPNHTNEFDALVIKDNHLHMVECKFVHFLDGSGLIYKVNSVAEHLGDLSKASIISVGAHNITETQNGKKRIIFTLGDIARAKASHIHLYQHKHFNKLQLQKELREHFNL